MCAPSPASDVSLHRFANTATNASRKSGQASIPFSPCAHKVTNGSQHTEQSCQRPNVSFITISHAHTLVAAAKDLPPPRFPTPDTLHWPNISLYYTLCPCLVGGDRGPHVSFLCWRIHGKEKRGCNNAHEDQLRHCEIEPTCFLNKPAGLSVHSSMLFSVCEFHKKKSIAPLAQQVSCPSCLAQKSFSTTFQHDPVAQSFGWVQFWIVLTNVGTGGLILGGTVVVVSFGKRFGRPGGLSFCRGCVRDRFENSLA